MASGTSVAGNQTLLTASTAPSLLLSIGLTGFPVPPAQILGYFWLYQFSTTSPFQSYVIDKGYVYRPGVLRKIPVAPLSSGYAYRLDVSWNSAGIAWTATIA